MMQNLVRLWLLLLWLGGAIHCLDDSLCAQGKLKESYSARILRKQQIEPNREGIRKYFKSLESSEALKQEINGLIKQLSSPKFPVRSEAFQKLRNRRSIPIELLVAGTKSKDPEIRFRCTALLRKHQREFAPLQRAVCQVISESKFEEFVPELFGVIEKATDSYLKQLARQAIVRTSTVRDLEFLNSTFQNENREMRLAVIESLAKLEAKKHRPVFLRSLNDSSDRIRLAAAKALANLGDRECLMALVKLLDSKNLQVRYQSDYLLRSLTKQDFKFRPYASESVRAQQKAQWKYWVSENGAKAKLHFPVQMKKSRSNLKEGHLLLAYGHRNVVREFDAAGNVIFEYKTKHVWSAEKLPSGNILVSDYSKNRAVELDMNNKVVWEFQCKGCLNARPLANGNVLVVSHLNKKIMEVTRDKKVIFEVKTRGYACDAHRLPDGNTLIAEDGIVRIVNPKGKNVWEYGAKHPYGVEPLPNGNILIADITDSHVIEVTPEKKVVWTFRERAAGDAYRLPNGNTLITGTQRFLEVTQDKKVVWERKGNHYGSARK